METSNRKNDKMHIRYFDCASLHSGAFPALSGDEIHIWYADACDGRLLAQTAVLSDGEQAQAERYKNEHARMCYQTGHTALRLLLARYLDKHAETLTFTHGAHGKPALANQNDVHFNISHSGDRIALALAATPVGVDIEHAREARKTDLIARRFFHPEEAAIYQSLPDAQRKTFFYERWTAREAALKALGIGLTVETNAFLVQRCADSGMFRITDGPAGSERLLLTGIDCPDGYVGCVACLT